MPKLIANTIATIGLLAGLVAGGSVIATPSYATMSNYNYHGCHWHSGKKYCPSSQLVPGTSTELFPSTCNGVLGFWEDPVKFANGETLCIARSTADFYHNGNLAPTCTVKQKVQGHWVVTSTLDGACPSFQPK